MKTPYKISAIFLLLFLTFSCTKEVDFDQIDDVDIHTSYLVTLVYFNLEAPDFLTSQNIEEPVQADVIQASFANVSQKYVEKVKLTILTNNEFNRDFNVEIIFFDIDQNPIYQLDPILIPANSTELTTVIEIPSQDIPVVFNTAYYGFIIALSASSDGSVLQPDDVYSLEFKSSLELFFNYKNI
ncbi:hypothetical protein ACFQ5N_06830 [Lutibacter holmesii]|uniref:DUF1735 domain-containing protein n=1 Tax=Lutibacter holmesii TaxID=1137985 RepID=A0ABW3WMS1_9FLAO